jgi:uncharacterized protein with PIN domain
VITKRHKDVMEDIYGNPTSDCDGELEFKDSGLALDVYWVVYRCRKCGKEVWTVQGGRHWWNFER